MRFASPAATASAKAPWSAKGSLDIRHLVLPVAVKALAFCGESNLCVAHENEYVIISIASGSVRELFRFAADHGAPFVRRLSAAELVVVQPPLHAGERQLGVFLDHKGHVARRSTSHWRQPPLDVATRGRTVVTLLPNAVEVNHPECEPPMQSIPFAEGVAIADGGLVLLVANRDHVFALMPPVRRREWASPESPWRG